MREKLTYLDTLNLQKVMRIGGDLLLLPEQHAYPYEEYRALCEGEMIDEGESMIATAAVGIFNIVDKYQLDRYRQRREPRWIHKYPVSIRTQARYNYTIHNEDPLAIMNAFPNTGISYMITEDGLCEDLEQMFKLRRLQGIRQLGFLQAPWFSSLKYESPLAEHNRLMHSYDVMTIATLIAYNNNLPKGLFNTLRAAAMTHDMGTPAGGDSVKLIDLEALDEDHNYARLLAQFPERKRLWRKYRISERRLIATVQGKGLLGQLLDIADKIAYVARDLWACDPFIQYAQKQLEQYGLRTLLSLLHRYPNPCSLWDSVVVENGQVMITNPAALTAFLKIRTLLFRELYYHPHARFGEYLISRLLVKSLYVQGKLTRDQLLKMRDDELQRILNAEYPVGRELNWKPVVEILSEGAQCKSFKDIDEAERFRKELQEQGKVFVLLEDTRNAIIKTAVHLPVATKEGPKPFKEAFPGDAREIEEMALIAPAIHVYYLKDESHISGEQLQEIAESLGNT
jgi:HD superfamily phosphohydrolase